MSKPHSRDVDNTDPYWFLRYFGDQKASQWGGVIRNKSGIKNGQDSVPAKQIGN